MAFLRPVRAAFFSDGNLQILCGDGPCGGCSEGKGNTYSDDWRRPGTRRLTWKQRITGRW